MNATPFTDDRRPLKPPAAPPMVELIPAKLKEIPQWVTWKYIWRKEGWQKVPFDPTTGEPAKSNVPSTWASFDTALKRARTYAGIGYVFSAGDEFCGIDLDGCRDPKTQKWADWAKEIIREFDTYTELSPSGSGAKMFIRGKFAFDNGKKVSLPMPSMGGKEAGVEVYDKLRYFAVTGKRLDGVPTEPQSRQAALDRYSKIWFSQPARSSARCNGHAGGDKRKIIDRAAKYIKTVPPSISGQKGHDAAFKVACALVLGFDLMPDEAYPLFCEWNQTCQPPWNEREIRHKLSQADKKPDERGYLLNGHGPQRPAIDLISNGFRDKEGFVPTPMREIIACINRATKGWPRRIGDALFVHERPDSVDWLETPAALFGYLGTKTGRPPTFHNDATAHSRAEVFAELRREAQSYLAVETLPHEPSIEEHYYACRIPTAGKGDTLRQFIGRFRPATDIDTDLLTAFFVTLFWGGRTGGRPCFALTSDDGRGSGKTSVVSNAGRLAGGMIELSANEDAEIIKQRLLSPDGLTKRLAVLDNVKSLRFSWAELEGLITSPAISGKALYVGEATRPNNIVWALTLNGVSLATDMAQRSVIIKLVKPKRSGTWAEDTYAFIDANRDALIADCIGFLRRDRQELPGFSRWAAWENDVLSRLPEPSDAQRVILERQGASDVEQEEAAIVQEYIECQLSALGYDTERDRVFIPSPIAREWFNSATGERVGTTNASRWMNQQIDERKLCSIVQNRCRTYGRGFVWIGPNVDPDQQITTDLESRIERMKGR